MTADLPEPSDPRAARWIAILLAVVVLLLLAGELGTRRIAMPSSRIERRIHADIDSARHIGAAHGTSVLIVGNSLLERAVDTLLLHQGMAPEWTARRLDVEQTYYLDWWFGLRSLWDAGAGPSHIVVMLDAGQLASPLTRGDYSAMRLVSARDLISMGREAGLHPTEISRLVLSHFSAYYGFRGESRKVLLGKIIPGMAELVGHFTPRGHGKADTVATEAVAYARLRDLKAAIEAHGATFTFAIPPVSELRGDTRAVVRAAVRAGVPVIVPEPLPAQLFFDGYHVNDTGARLYTGQFVHDLRARLATGK